MVVGAKCSRIDVGGWWGEIVGGGVCGKNAVDAKWETVLAGKWIQFVMGDWWCTICLYWGLCVW